MHTSGHKHVDCEHAQVTGLEKDGVAFNVQYPPGFSVRHGVAHVQNAGSENGSIGIHWSPRDTLEIECNTFGGKCANDGAPPPPWVGGLCKGGWEGVACYSRWCSLHILDKPYLGRKSNDGHRPNQ